ALGRLREALPQLVAYQRFRGRAGQLEATDLEFLALLRQRQELQARIEGEFGELRDLERPSDEADLASREEQRQWQLRLLEREKKLLDKIDEALERLARGDYGW
ncbi:hypothetical protein ACM6PT_37165, partial [Klebsiella pneumoniae]